MTPDERAAAFRGATRHLRGHGPRDLADLAAELVAEVLPGERADTYGAGEGVAALERDLAARFGKEAAVFAPSGTLLQPAALRIHADRRSTRTVGFHATCHLEQHEHRGYAHLHGLQARWIGPRHRPFGRADLDAVPEPLAAVLVELPQRELGGPLLPWDEVLAVADGARTRGAAVHLDGARIWETTPHYGRSLAELAAPFDTVYVSLYKVLGAVAGAALLGDAATIAEARIWIRRAGGNLVTSWPMVLSARRGLRERLPKVPDYVRRAQEIAALLVGLGLRVTPDPPPTNLFHAFAPVDADRLVDACAALARDTGLALVTAATPADVPGFCRFEVPVGDGALALSDNELRERFAQVLRAAAG